MKSLHEQLGGTYHEGENGLLYPDLHPPEEDAPAYGEYGRMCLAYLRQHHEGLYTGLLLSGKLNAHLNDISETANAQTEMITRQLAKAQGITKELNVH